MEPAIATARTRARAAVRAEIIAAARRQLGVDGASALSLRAVTRELGMASSAAYRYFPSRDDLLTALIVEAYDALGEVTEQAARQDTDAFARWLAMGRAIRAWALQHPHEYALIYGSPVPGYQAPQDTIGPASRVTLTLAGVVVDAHSAGELRPPEGPPLGRAMAAEAKRVGRLALPGVPPPVGGRGAGGLDAAVRVRELRAVRPDERRDRGTGAAVRLRPHHDGGRDRARPTGPRAPG